MLKEPWKSYKRKRLFREWLKPTIHAIEKYIKRSGVEPMTAYENLKSRLESARPIDTVEAYAKFKVSTFRQGDLYFCWYEPLIQKDMLAIIDEDGNIITIFIAKGPKARPP